MFLFFHALALALSLFGGFGGGFTHVGAALSAPMAGGDGEVLGPPDSGGSMPSDRGSGPMGGGQGGF